MSNEKSPCHWPMQGSVTGRLLSYSPKTKKTHVLAGDLFYANGVVVAHDQSFLLVVETMSVTIHKYWLKGPKVCEHVSKHRKEKTKHFGVNLMRSQVLDQAAQSANSSASGTEYVTLFAQAKVFVSELFHS